jgi:hypothetical protein
MLHLTRTIRTTLLKNVLLLPRDFLPEDLISLLKINRENNESQAARLIMDVHFVGSDMNMQPFIEMDLKVKPVAISWVAQDDNCQSRSSLYHCFRTMM